MPALFDISSLFPPEVACAILRITSPHPTLHPLEHAAVERAVVHRRKEFAAGRACARDVLRQLGIADPVVLKNPDGSPAWPQGIVGSISHSREWCAAAAAPANLLRGIGIDIETIKRVTPTIARKIMTEPEIRMLDKADPQEAQTLLCLIFSAKEALYKCLYPVWGKRLGFHDAVITLHLVQHRFEALITTPAIPLRTPLVGAYLIHRGTVVTCITLPADRDCHTA